MSKRFCKNWKKYNKQTKKLHNNPNFPKKELNKKLTNTTKIGDYMNEYKPNISINNEIITLNETMPQSDDPLIQLYIDSQKQKVYKTEENKPIKKRDKLYFASLGAKLGEESAKRIGKIRERYKNKQTN